MRADGGSVRLVDKFTKTMENQLIPRSADAINADIEKVEKEGYELRSGEYDPNFLVFWKP
jgi:hypothetical protein